MMRRSARLVVAGRSWWGRSLGGRSFSRMRELDLDTHALALCAQQVLCTAPLVVAMSAVLQRTTGKNVSVVISKFFGLHDDSADDITKLFGRSSNSISTTALVLGLITAVVFTTSVAAVQQRGFELIWTLPRVTGIRSYLRQLAWAPALTLFTIFVLIAGRLGHWLNHNVIGIGPWAVILLQSIVTILFYWWTQHWLLRGRVEWRALLPGALVVGVLTTAMVRVSRSIMDNQISWQVHAYGLVGAVFVLSVWLMVLSAVILTGILLGAIFVERRADPNDIPLADQIERSPLTVKGLISSVEDVDDTAPRPSVEDVAPRSSVEDVDDAVARASADRVKL
ncbi:MAG: YihY/virulence factor BrkB family protein [Actinomycetota bacterium]|nr:YihY/virulence factor BrkB family protein [Actinomycetota bacterium]